MNKRALLLLGLVTLIGFPIPTFLGLYFLEDITPLQLLQIDNFQAHPILLGTGIGILYAAVALVIMQAPIFKTIPTRVETLVANMKLTVIECLFLSICAGVGEELLFRSGVQFYLGPILTSVIFVAIHGYLNPWNWRMSLYGILVLPFILLISYAFTTYGLWFCVFAHMAYDFVLFLVMRKETNEL